MWLFFFLKFATLRHPRNNIKKPSPSYIAAMSDIKERNFCFAYKGGRLSIEILESLHAIRAEGTECEDNGYRYVRISLHRNYGRRVANIPNIIEEYNAKVSERGRIEPIALNPTSSKFICFKTTGLAESNPILYRINTDSQSNPAYWKWEAKPDKLIGKRKTAPTTPQPKPTKNKRRKQGSDARITTGLEGLARDLNLDPNLLDMQGAYVKISQNYLAIKGEALNTTGQFEAEDRAFLLDQLSRFFNREMAYTTKPFETSSGHRKLGNSSQHAKTIAALAARNGVSIDEYEFMREEVKPMVQKVDTELKEPNPFTPQHPNETISACLQQMVSRWLKDPTLETAKVSTNDIVRELNGGELACGTYRSTCVPGFLRPFITEGLIQVEDETKRPWSYLVDIKGVAAKLHVV